MLLFIVWELERAIARRSRGFDPVMTLSAQPVTRTYISHLG
jgi:hypothetical protein